MKLTCCGVVLTNTLEVWNSDDITVEINEILLATLQIDVVNKIDITFSRKKLFHKMIWAAVGEYTISFKDDGLLFFPLLSFLCFCLHFLTLDKPLSYYTEEKFSNGYQKMVARYPGEEFQEKIAQFIDSQEDVCFLALFFLASFFCRLTLSFFFFFLGQGCF